MNAVQLDCPACHGDAWITDVDGRPVGKCPACAPPSDGIARAMQSRGAAAIRQAILDRAAAPGEFAVEDIVEAAFGPDATFGNATGAVTSGLARQGVISRTGYRPARRASRAGGTVSIWRGRRSAS